MAQISSTKCNVCSKGLGKFFCYECKNFLCDSCNTFHAQFPATKRHCVADSHNIDRATSIQLLCAEHKLEFVVYCLACDSLLCSSCVTTKHNGHSFTDVAEITAKARTVVNDNLAILKEKIVILSDLIERTKLKDIDFIKEEMDKYINTVNQVSDDVGGIVNSITEINISRASDYYVTEKQGLEYSIAKLEKINNEYKMMSAKMEQLLLQKHEVVFCLSHKSLAKEQAELDDIPNTEEPIPIEKFRIDDYIDFVIEKIQSKYPIRSLKVKDNEIQLLKQSLEQEKIRIVELQQTKDAELKKCCKEMQALKFEAKQRAESLKKADNEIQHLKQCLAQEKANIAELQRTKDAYRKEIQKLETDLKQSSNTLYEMDNEIQYLKQSLAHREVNIVEIQRTKRTKDAELVKCRKKMQRLETDVNQCTEYLKAKDDKIQELIQHIQSLSQKRVNIPELQKTKIAKMVKLGRSMPDFNPRTELRVALIGMTGVGKSSVGNTLFGSRIFKSMAASKSVTIQCEVQSRQIASGRTIKVLDTPGIMDTEGRDVCDVITNAMSALSPGPHAFLVILYPGESTHEERFIQQLKDLFADKSFLKHTIIIMTRKDDIIADDNLDPINIHKYMDTMAPLYVTDLYRQCGKRIVAVENKRSSWKEKEKYAEKIVDELMKMEGYYSH